MGIPLTIAELKHSASARARSGVVKRARAMSYAESAEVAAANASMTDIEQFALWWVKARLDSVGVVSRKWEGLAKDLPYVVEAERARSIVARAEHLWVRAVVASYERALAG